MGHDPNILVKRVLKVASLPEIYMKVEQVLSDPNSSNIQLARIIEEDPALTARLLRLANSAFYGFAAKVEEVNQAITVLGTQQLRELVLACSVLKAFENMPDYLINMELFWRHSIACGVVARALASLRHESNVERYFVAGLLHDIGRLILLMELPKAMGKIFQQARQDQKPLFLMERQTLGFHHARLGGILLKHWKLSPRLIEGITFHHAPSSAQSYPVDAAIIHISDLVANAMQMGSSGEQYVPKLSPKAWTKLSLGSDVITDVLDTLHEQYADAISFILDE